jgi:para-aminobenzoate synthetase/4-amino-4-deoxychorismate lyase
VGCTPAASSAAGRAYSAGVVLRSTPLRCRLSPDRAVLALRGDAQPFALIGAWAGGGAVLGSDPVRTAPPGQDPFALLAEQPQLAPGEGAGAVGGGWFGYVGFGLGATVERLDPPPPAPVPLPAAALAFYDHVLRCDAGGRWFFEALVTPEREAAIESRRRELTARLGRAPESPRPFSTEGWRWTPAPGAHAALVAAARERIRAGDLLQANLCLRLDGRLQGEALDVFATAVRRLPTDRAALISGPWGSLVSLSPELFLERRGRQVRSAPIKGTRPLEQRDELEASAKDRAENVMIVDLMRNDLGRVCTPGSVTVTALAEIRQHAGVWHMVSEVEGTLRADVDDGALLRATFPPGSVTGAPKVAALNVISELESTRREAYTGAIGFASPALGLELSVAIRTFEIREERIWLGVGGGIVADSVPAHEAAEARTKAAPPLAAIGAGPLASSPPPARAPAPVRRGPRPVPRPDPAAGLYETIRIAGGVPRRWPAHLERLAASARALYGRELPDGLGPLVLAWATGRPDGRLRIDLVPGAEPQITVTPLPVPAPPILRPVLLPGGLGAHKWRDRGRLEAWEAEDPGTLPLLLDADGYVLETSRTGVIARGRDRVLYTPPADGRILPSLTVAGTPARAHRLTLEDLRAASQIFVASALRGLQPARLQSA